jgi:TonB family protein
MVDKLLNSCNFMGMFWMMVAAAAAGQLAGPRTIDAVRVFSPDDMPAYVQRAGVDRFVFARTTILPDGTVQNCEVERSSGDRKLDALSCAIIVKRAKFRPSKWTDGSPAYGVLRAPVSWTIGGPPSKKKLQKAFPADLDVTVSGLPARARAPVTVHLTIAVDETGRVVGCDEGSSFSQHDKRFPELVPTACQQVAGKYTASPANDASGQPVRSVQNVVVDFSTGS